MHTVQTIDYIGGNKDWLKFSDQVSQNTGTVYSKMWLDNGKANKELVLKSGWASEFQGLHEGKATVMIGASPALKNQVGRIRELQNDPDFVLIGLTCNLKYLLENGIKPHYCMIADADPKMVRFWETLDMSLTRDVTLIASVCTHPSMLEMWQGPIKFLAVYTSIYKLDKKLRKWYRPINGIGEFFPAISSQYNTGTAFAYQILQTKVIIFVGNELGFSTPDVPYYVDREDVKDKWKRTAYRNIYGDMYYTNFMLFSLKLTLEDYLGKISGDGWFLNATEDGIFGVVSAKNDDGTREWFHLPWIKQLRLEMAISQAKHILKEGRPIMVEDILKEETVNG